jgi:hypothetical protein
MKSHKDDPSNRKSMNHQLTEAISAKLTLEGKGDIFWFKSWSLTKVTHQTKNQRIVNLPKLAPLN